ncbi:MAG: WD40 repeat domain-containing protein [Myxococcota bacterium]|nr:WD40 repeat domain-containing protein [Myxococcota bacterium]
MKRTLLAALVWLGCLVVPGAAWATLIGIGFDRTLYSIDESDGSGSSIGVATAPANLNSGAIDGSGTIYSVTVSNDQLVLIQADGSSSLGPMLSREISARGIAFSPAGVLFAIEGEFGFEDDILVTIDVGTGDVATIGSMGIDQVQALAFAPDGTLYGWDGNEGLLTVDPSTGTATDVDAAVGGTFAIQAIEFSPDGTLYGAQDALFTISTADGSTTEVGSGSYENVRGLAYVPEPGSGLLLLGGLLALSARARRRA